jgi:hypothetical protein
MNPAEYGFGEGLHMFDSDEAVDLLTRGFCVL